MMTRNWALAGAISVATLFLAMGCVKRTERISIAADGRVTMAVEIEGKPNELEGGDAMPTKEAGWDVKRTTKIQELDGKSEETVVLEAKREFEPGATLPETYSTSEDPDAELYVHFPTKVWFEKRGNDTYVHFKRVYAPRAWNFVQFGEDQAFDNDIKVLSKKPVEELTPDDRLRILRAFGNAEASKQLELAEIALKKVAPDHAPDIWLNARSALLTSFDEIDWVSLAAIHASAEKDRGDQLLEDSMMWVHPEDGTTRRVAEDKKNERFEKEHQKIEADAHEAFVNSLKKYGGFNKAKIEAFEKEWTRARKLYDITGATGGHGFEIHVQMPGEIVAHNATSVDDGWCKWEFTGEAFRDRSPELLVTSKLPRK